MSMRIIKYVALSLLILVVVGFASFAILKFLGAKPINSSAPTTSQTAPEDETSATAEKYTEEARQYLSKNDSSKAREYFSKALNIYKKLGDKENVTAMENEISSIDKLPATNSENNLKTPDPVSP
jgi:catalase